MSGISLSGPGTYPTSTLKWLRSKCHLACRPVGPVGVFRVSWAHSSRLLWSVKISTGCRPIHDAHFFSALTIAYASFSRTIHFAPWPGVNFLLRKATGTVFWLNVSWGVIGPWAFGSCSKTAPIAFCEASTLSTNGASGFTACSDNPDTKAAFNLLKASKSLSDR